MKSTSRGRKSAQPKDDLQRRAEAFLALPIPEELRPRYVSGSLADITIANHARGEPADSELLEMAELAALEYDEAIAVAQTTELRSYYEECQSLLRAIIAKSTA